jgi:hypothetical protein
VSRPVMPFASLAILLAAPLGAQQSGPAVSTSQYDNARTGATLVETTLTPQNVNVKQFGKLGTYSVDGAVYAEPLYVPNVPIPEKGTRNVVFVATEHDSVYAFDADKPGDAPLWHVSFLDASKRIETVPARDANCPFISPEIGITSTPVIDMKTGTLYVLARTMVAHTVERNEYPHTLHALAITTGVEKFGGPRVITATSRGKGDGSSGGQVDFNGLRENPRASLVLTGDALYLAWASACDVDPYHGWIMAYDPTTLEQKAVLNVTPDGSEGGIWQSDTGPAADADGNVYIAVGNGTFDAAAGGADWGDSLLKVKLDGGKLAVRDSFTPFDQENLSKHDWDLGASGPSLLPEQPGEPRHIAVQPGKNGEMYVLNRDKLGRYGKGSDAILQRFSAGEGCYTAPAYWNSRVYIACEDRPVTAYTIDKGQLHAAETSTVKFANPGATPTVSANGNKDGIVWVIATKTWNGAPQPAVLYAFDAMKLGAPLYTSEENATRDRASGATRFVIPLVVNGRVYFGGREGAKGAVNVYGLLK